MTSLYRLGTPGRPFFSAPEKSLIFMKCVQNDDLHKLGVEEDSLCLSGKIFTPWR